MRRESPYSAGDVIGNRYVIEDILGRSPSAFSLVCNENHGSRKLVVKVYPAEIASRYFNSNTFFLKAGAQAEIEHDNLARCLDVQEEMGQVYLVRDFVDGEDFRSFRGRNAANPQLHAKGIEWLWQAAQGLGEIHRQGRHLNLHPGNILIGPIAAKVVDGDPRGLGALEVNTYLPVDGANAPYRAPELRQRGQLAYPSSDLYALGAMVLLLLRGEDPPLDPEALLSAVTETGRDFGPEAQAFLRKALAARPEDRFKDAESFGEALWKLGPALPPPREGGPRPREAIPAPPPREFGGEAREKPRGETAGAAGGEAYSRGAAGGTVFGTSGSASLFDRFEGEASFVSGPSAPPEPSAPDPLPRSTPPRDEVNPALHPAPPVFQSPRAPAPRPPAPSGSSGGPASRSGQGFGSRFGEGPGTRSGGDATSGGGNATLSGGMAALERESFEPAPGREESYTQFGFKGAGTRAEGDPGSFLTSGRTPGQDGRWKVWLLVGGALLFTLAFGGLALWALMGESPGGSPSQEDEIAEEGAGAPDRESAEAGDGADESFSAPETVPPSEALPRSAGDEPDAGRTATGTIPPSGNPAASGNSVNTGTAPGNAGPARIATGNADPAGASASGETAMERARPPAGGASPPGRIASLLAAFSRNEWPRSAGECLGLADELNDSGKTAEAAVAYGKALGYAEVTAKEKVRALGGLAVTHDRMGNRQEALKALDRLLALEPENRFAKRLKARLGGP